MAEIAAMVGVGYLAALTYAGIARAWAIAHRAPPEAIPPLPDRPPFVVLPDHPHSITGWNETGCHITCASADFTEAQKVRPDARRGEHLCRDCRGMLAENGVSVAEWAERHNQIVRAHTSPKARTPWLWPVWLLLKPLEMIAPDARPATPETDGATEEPWGNRGGVHEPGETDACEPAGDRIRHRQGGQRWTLTT